MISVGYNEAFEDIEKWEIIHMQTATVLTSTECNITCSGQFLPTRTPSRTPSITPSDGPTASPLTSIPSPQPSFEPSKEPSGSPSSTPTIQNFCIFFTLSCSNGIEEQFAQDEPAWGFTYKSLTNEGSLFYAGDLPGYDNLLWIYVSRGVILVSREVFTYRLDKLSYYDSLKQDLSYNSTEVCSVKCSNNHPTFAPTLLPTYMPTTHPSPSPTTNPSSNPTTRPSTQPSAAPVSSGPTFMPTVHTSIPSAAPTITCIFFFINCENTIKFGQFKIDGPYFIRKYVSMKDYGEASKVLPLSPSNQNFSDVHWLIKTTGGTLVSKVFDDNLEKVNEWLIIDPVTFTTIGEETCKIDCFSSFLPSLSPVTSLPSRIPSSAPVTSQPSKQPSDIPSIKPYISPTASPTITCFIFTVSCENDFHGTFKREGPRWDMHYKSMTNPGDMFFQTWLPMNMQFAGKRWVFFTGHSILISDSYSEHFVDIGMWNRVNNLLSTISKDACAFDCRNNQFPTFSPSTSPATNFPSKLPSFSPTDKPTLIPSSGPTVAPTSIPTNIPSSIPSNRPSTAPTETCISFRVTCVGGFSGQYNVREPQWMRRFENVDTGLLLR